VKVILAVYHNNLMAIIIYLSDHWKFLRIRPSEIEFQSDLSKFVFNCYSYTFLIAVRIRPLRLNLGTISAVISVFVIQELSIFEN